MNLTYFSYADELNDDRHKFFHKPDFFVTPEPLHELSEKEKNAQTITFSSR